MPDFVIREATDEDGAALERLVADVSAGGREGALADADAFARPATHYAERGGRLWVVERDGALAGSLGLTAHVRPKEFELSLLCLDEETRGQGFAAALLAGANAFAAASGGDRLSVWVDAASEETERFCERHGFKRAPGLRAGPEGSGRTLHQFTRDVEA
jgi:putative acetyltransferase